MAEPRRFLWPSRAVSLRRGTDESATTVPLEPSPPGARLLIDPTGPTRAKSSPSPHESDGQEAHPTVPRPDPRGDRISWTVSVQTVRFVHASAEAIAPSPIRTVAAEDTTEQPPDTRSWGAQLPPRGRHREESAVSVDAAELRSECTLPPRPEETLTPASEPIVLTPVNPGAMVLRHARDVEGAGEAIQEPTSLDAPTQPLRGGLVAERAEAQAIKAGARLAMADCPASSRAEAVRLLCHRLRMAGDPRWLAIAPLGEGNEAAVCAAELGLAYAELGLGEVLVLELDTRAPKLAQTLGLDVQHCFAEQVLDRYTDSTEPWRALTMHSDKLLLMPVRPPTTSSVARILPHMFQQAAADLSRLGQERLIVVCPKLTDSAEIALLEGVVQGALLTGTLGRAAVSEVRDASRQLGPVPLLGLALWEP